MFVPMKGISEGAFTNAHGSRQYHKHHEGSLYVAITESLKAAWQS